MSLVNEALKKARLEAARQEAARRGLPLPGARSAENRPAVGPGLLRAGIVALLVAVATLLFFAGRITSPEPRDGPTGREARIAGAPVEPAAVRDGAEAMAEIAPAEPPAAASEQAPIRESVNQPTTAPVATENPATRPQPPAPPAAESDPTRTERSSRIRVRSALEAPTAAAPKAVEPPVATARSEPTSTIAPAAERPASPSPDLRTEVRTLELPGSRRVELGGIAWSEERPFALINGRVVGPGDTVESLTVVEIRQRAVELKGDAGHFLLRLK